MRLFVAVDLPEDVVGALADNVEDLKETCPRARYTREENCHITLAFLGEQQEESIERIVAAMTNCTANFEVFDVAMGDYGVFGAGQKAILWQGFEESDNLVALAELLRSELIDQSVKFDEKEFKPHITLARKFDADVSTVEEPWVGEGEVESISLYQSVLTPEGPEYTRLATCDLQKPFEHPPYPLVIIDADACPVTRDAIDEARHKSIPVVLVGNGTQNLEKHLKKNDSRVPTKGFWAKTINVLGGADSADFKIATIVKSGDVVITQDIGVAAMALGADAKAIGVRGREYTKATIDSALLIRHEEKKVRRQGGRTQGPSAFTEEDRDRFRSAFRRILSQM